MAGEDGGREADAGRGRRHRVKGISPFAPATDVASPPADAGETSPSAQVVCFLCASRASREIFTGQLCPNFIFSKNIKPFETRRRGLSAETTYAETYG